MQFITRQPLGFDKEGLVIVPLVSENAMKNHAALRDAFSQLPEVIGVGASSEIPGSGFTMNGYFPEGMKEPMMINVVDVDERFLEVMGIPVVEGRSFDATGEADRSAFLVNQALAKDMGWESPVGKKINRDGEHTIIGVVGDFHFASLHEPIRPLVITREPWIGYNLLTVKVRPGNEEVTLKKLEAAWSATLPQEPFSSFTYNDYMKDTYRTENSVGKAVLWFSLLAIFIACLGLLGLASYTYNQRKKEIGIRKVLGARSGQVAWSITFSFLRLVLLAGAIALPLAWWLSQQWMESFAFKAFIGPFIFIVPVLLVAALAWLTIYFQVNRLANTNPSDVLKFE